jgi:ribosome-associated protein
MKTMHPPLCGHALAERAAAIARDKKADSIVILPLADDAGIADFFLICEADNNMHTRAIADWIVTELKAEHCAPWHVEGREEGQWILIDYSDVVIHVMTTEMREYYRIEELHRRKSTPSL